MSKYLLFISLLFFNYNSYASVSEFNFDNGLKLLVKENNRAPIFITQVWYKVGASDESLGITGISHMLEHMMFKGTKNYKAGEFSKIIARNGGTDNAFTAQDYTAYYQKMNKNNLEVALKLEADRMQNLLLKDIDFNTEREVVIEERRLRVEDKPIAKLYEKLSEISFDNTGVYHYPVIGIMADLEAMSLAALAKWYKLYYSPNNATIVVVGDVEADNVYKLVAKYFSNIKLSNIKNIVRESKPLTAATTSISLVAKTPYYAMSYPVVSLNSADNAADAYALEVLSYALGGNDNAILNKLLIRELQLVHSISVSYYIYDKYDTGFVISFSPAAGVGIEQVLQVIDEQITKLNNKLISKQVLTDIIIQAEADYIYSQDSISTQAYYLGALETVGLGYKTAAQYVDKIRLITPKKVQEVVRKYLIKDNIRAVELIPKAQKNSTI